MSDMKVRCTDELEMTTVEIEAYVAKLREEKRQRLITGRMPGILGVMLRSMPPRDWKGRPCHAGSPEWRRWRRAVRRGEIVPTLFNKTSTISGAELTIPLEWNLGDEGVIISDSEVAKAFVAVFGKQPEITSDGGEL